MTSSFWLGILFLPVCGLSLVIGELSPILGQSLGWFEGETRRMAEVRFSELETGLSSSSDPEGGGIQPSLPLG